MLCLKEIELGHSCCCAHGGWPLATPATLPRGFPRGSLLGYSIHRALACLETCQHLTVGCMARLQGLATQLGKPGVPRVHGGNPYVTPDSTVHDPKMQDVELGKKGGL